MKKQARFEKYIGRNDHFGADFEPIDKKIALLPKAAKFKSSVARPAQWLFLLRSSQNYPTSCDFGKFSEPDLTKFPKSPPPNRAILRKKHHGQLQKIQ